MSEEELKPYRVKVTLEFKVEAKSAQHAQIIVENGISIALRLKPPAVGMVVMAEDLWISP